MKRPAGLAGLFSLVLTLLASICFLTMSKNIAMLNQGDFFQAFDSLLDKNPLDVTPYYVSGPAAFIWAYTDSKSKVLAERNPSWIYLWMNTKIQQVFSNYFDLFTMALFSKLILLACCYRLSTECLRHVGLPPLFQLPIFLLFLITCAYAHNVGFLNSFYGEHTFLVFVPVALVGMFERTRWVRMVLIPMGLLLASGAKPQYFYLAALAAAVMVLFSLMGRRKMDLPMVGLLLIAFALSWFYAFNAGGNAANYYNSTYFGSYLLLGNEQLQKLGVKAANLECVGVDPWGNKVDRADTLKLTLGPANCVQRAAVPLKSVLAPYLAHPRLVVDMWRWLAPVHFTVRYFHVYPETKYIIPSGGKSFHAGNTLVWLSALRERFVTPYYAVIVVVGLVLPFVSYGSVVSIQIKAAMFLLAVFIPSQFVVCLLGEGARDLSKHLAGSQYCLDVLCVLILLQFGAYLYSKTGSA